MVGNRGFRRYLSAKGKGFQVDPAKIERDRRYDGKRVLRTTTDRDAADIAWAYKQLWTVEEIEVEKKGNRFVLRSEAPGSAGKAFQAAGVALPPTIRKVS